MEKRDDILIPYKATHPGEILREELRERGFTSREFASRIKMQPSHLSEILKGHRDISDSVAILLEEHLGISSEVWIRLQHSYIRNLNLIAKRDEEERKALEFEHVCSAIFDIKTLYKRLGLVKETICKRVSAIREMYPFDLRTATDLTLNLFGMYKHSTKLNIEQPKMITWLLLNHLAIRATILPEGYVRGNGLKAAEEIAAEANRSGLTTSFIRESLGSHGIGYVVVEKVEKAPIDAFSTILNGRPVITVTQRCNDINKMTFDILHELFHIERHLPETPGHSYIAIYGEEGYHNDEREMEADAFARNMLIPDAVWAEIMKSGSKNLTPGHIINKIASEARKRGYNPSIAVARYRHDTNDYRGKSYRPPKIY